MELSKNIPFFRFSRVRISFFGIWMKVSPKNTLLGLKLEKKQIRWFVTYRRPCNMILSASAQENVFLNYSPSTKLIFDWMKSKCFFHFFEGEPSNLSSASFIHYSFSTYYFYFSAVLDYLLSTIFISAGFLSFLKSLFFYESSSKTIFPERSGFRSSANGLFFNFSGFNCRIREIV